MSDPATIPATLMGQPIPAEAPVAATPPVEAAPTELMGKKLEEAPKADAPAVEAPIKYEFKVPEGVDPKSFKEAADEVTAFAQKHKLPLAVAQELVDRESQADKLYQEKYNHAATVGWLQELKADKDFGGDKFTASTSQVNRAYQKLPDAVKQVISDNKLQFNPMLFKIMHAFGGMLKEDSVVKGEQPGAPKKHKTLEDIFGA